MSSGLPPVPAQRGFGFSQRRFLDSFRIADDPGVYRGRPIDRQLSCFSSSNSDSVARTSEAAFRLYPASSFMSQRIFGERSIRSANFFDSPIASGMMASPNNRLASR